MIPGALDMPMSAARVLDQSVSEHPDREALVARGGRLTYRQLDDLAARSARALIALGVRPGDRLAVSLPNDLDIVGAFHGAMRLGAVWVGVNRQLAAPEKVYIVKDSESRVFLGDHETVAQLGARRQDVPDVRLVEAGPGSEWEAAVAASPGERPDPPDPLSPAGIAYTSGTTGFPKGAIHSQHNLMVPGAALVASRRYGPTLRKADCFPFTILNLHALSTLLVPQAGGTAIVMDRVDAAGIAEWCRGERPNVFNGAPAMLFSLTATEEVEPADLSSLEEVWSGGGHCPPATMEGLRSRFGRPVITTYGLTEAPSMVAILPLGDQEHRHTSGIALPHLSLGVVGPDDQPLPPGEVGEITVGPVRSGPWADAYRPMLGYWKRDEATASVLRRGVLHTGDLGSLDEEGYLHVADRQSSLILRGGANVYPAEVERVLAEHPAVADSCVVGMADERLGERVVAMVEPRSGTEIDEAELRRHCESNLARYKVPERFLFGSLPRNSMNKVRRPEVTQAFEASSA